MMTNASYIQNAWQRGLEVLKPTDLELERGLALHRELGGCDGYGFLPRVFTPALRDLLHGFQDRGMGIVEYKRKQWIYRITASTREEAAQAEFRAALDHAGLCGVVQTINDVGETLEDAVGLMTAYRHLCNTYKDRIFQATCADDFEIAKATGRTGVMFSLTGLPTAGAGSMADPEGLLDWLDVWYHAGVRFMHLGYNRRNYFADGCTETSDGGLSDFGRDLVARMNTTGIIVDVPHSSPKSTLDAVAISAKPVIATHTGCAAIHAHPRCKSDAELKAIADSGGYIGIFSIPELLGPDADLNLMLHHLRHAIKTVGAEHVTIGTDLAHQGPWPTDLRGHPAGANHRQKVGAWKSEPPKQVNLDHLGGSLTWTNWPLITVGLMRLGVREEEIAKILSGNLRRVLRACRPEQEGCSYSNSLSKQD